MFRRWLRNLGWVGAGLAAGLAAGLILGWEVWPTQFTNAVPEILQDSYRRDYAIMIATAYAVDGDLPAARRRVNSLGEEGAEYFFSVTLDAILRGENESEIGRLVRLAVDLGFESPALTPFVGGESNADRTP